jgi:antibiotic biosynthesis monooxygenase (ABM) superfamily enzyme
MRARMTERAQNADDEPVTVVVRRRAKPGRETDLEAWLRDVIAATKSFPGYQGSTVLRPRGPTQPEHVLVFRFASSEHLRGWQTSDVRADYLARAEAFTDEVEVVAQQGLEPFFDLPAHRAAPPPRWKMAVLTWVGLYPIVVLVGEGTRPLLEGLPFPVSAVPQTIASVALMAWLVMPAITRVASGWLYPPAAR